MMLRALTVPALAITILLAWGCKAKDEPKPTPAPKTAGPAVKPAPKPGVPKKKLPAGERAVAVVSAGLTLPGTLAWPARTQGSKLPGVVLVHGSGPHDRDEKIEQAGFTFKPFAELSAALVEAGFAVLRYDKRSFVLRPKLQAMKDRNQLLAEIAKLSHDQFIADARAALALLASQPEVDGDKLFFVGHSIAGLYAPVVAKEAKLAGVVLLAPILLPFRQHLIHQAEVQRDVARKQLAEAGKTNPLATAALTKQIANYDRTIAGYKKVFAMIDAGKFPAGGMLMGGTLDMFKGTEKLAEQLPARYAAIAPPLLYVNGKNDWICPVDAVLQHRKALERKQDLKLVILDDLNHFQYTNQPIAFSKQMAKTVADWMRKQL